MPDQCSCADCTPESETPLADHLRSVADNVAEVEQATDADDISLTLHGEGNVHIDLTYET